MCGGAGGFLSYHIIRHKHSRRAQSAAFQERHASYLLACSALDIKEGEKAVLDLQCLMNLEGVLQGGTAPGSMVYPRGQPKASSKQTWKRRTKW